VVCRRRQPRPPGQRAGADRLLRKQHALELSARWRTESRTDAACPAVFAAACVGHADRARAWVFSLTVWSVRCLRPLAVRDCCCCCCCSPRLLVHLLQVGLRRHHHADRLHRHGTATRSERAREGDTARRRTLATSAPAVPYSRHQRTSRPVVSPPAHQPSRTLATSAPAVPYSRHQRTSRPEERRLDVSTTVGLGR
jgi:hypothetical protein